MERIRWPADRDYYLAMFGYGKGNKTLRMGGKLPADTLRLAEGLEVCGDGVIAQLFHKPLNIPEDSKYTNSEYFKSERELLNFLKVTSPKIFFHLSMDDSTRVPAGKTLFPVSAVIYVLKAK